MYSLSKIFNIPVETLISINNLTSNNLYVGQELSLLENNSIPKDTITYTIERGDTLYSLAVKYKTTVDEIKKINNLTSNTLSIGEELIIPSYNNEIIEDYDIYIVEKGDSLWKISQKYNIPVTDLININNLDNLTLSINQQLLVPKNNEVPDNTYTVKSGDTLWSIARNNNITVDELKQKNNLSSNLLSVGQILII